MCFPELSEAEVQADIAQWRAEMADDERRRAGMLFCPDHRLHDGCYRMVRPGELAWRERPPLTWESAMSQLRRRYAGS
jgi:hypothetical protein